jgi:hypothetical protein
VRIAGSRLELGTGKTRETMRLDGPGSELRTDGSLPFDSMVLGEQLREIPLPPRTRSLLARMIHETPSRDRRDWPGCKAREAARPERSCTLREDRADEGQRSRQAEIDGRSRWLRELSGPGRAGIPPDTVDGRILHRAGEELRALIAWLSGTGPHVHPGRIAGLGPGSTPTGDDLLTGLLAAASRLEAGGVLDSRRVEALREDVRGLPRGVTTIVAREMLDHAADGWFPEPLARFANAMGNPGGAPEELAALAREIEKVGGTSGADWLAGAAGMLYATPAVATKHRPLEGKPRGTGCRRQGCA